MELPNLLFSGRLMNRYKRFLADVRLESGEVVTAHCPNSGSMKGCHHPESPVLLSRSENPDRKLKYTWELVRVNDLWVGINTNYPNRLVEEGIRNRVISELQGYDTILAEKKYGSNSRVDLLLENDDGKCYVEVKNVTLVEGGVAYFPDAVTRRGQKHLEELMAMVRQGHRAVLFFVVQRADGQAVAPADDIDPEYGRLLRKAVQSGVEALAYQARVSPQSINLVHRLAVNLQTKASAKGEEVRV